MSDLKPEAVTAENTEQQETKTTANYAFFRHEACEFFPCHKTAHPETFNCLFCYCPLYALGPDCGGNFTYTEDGIKNCTDCLLPHSAKGYDYVMKKFPALAELAKR